jgi:hypothetical protein
MDVRSEEGTIMLEWGIGMIFSIFILMFFLALSVHLYQRNMFTAACNAAVVRVAENYKYEGLEYKEEITVQDIENIGLYRYLSMKQINLLIHGNEKASSFLGFRLTKYSGGNGGGKETVRVKRVPDDLGRCHYVLEAEKSFDFLFAPLLEKVGLKESNKVKVVAVASTLDVLHYVNTVHFSQYANNKVSDLSKVAGVIDSFISLGKDLFGLVTSFGEDS